ncbi:LytR family transcriptional regulator [Streptococcus sp. X16XC17]|uniref:hypothetical protein n=1 Tax=unclassified Streptococcus TaxID=2608887 RepID=UPI00066FF98E|nr:MULTISPECIES: hypothetical protein [unclassified Streptococcus]TCD46472.1 LytR family transcriptional regulator [Streptococcus sp. X16XC17]
MTDSRQSIGILLDIYAYGPALKIAEREAKLSSTALYLLEMVKERRELNVAFLYTHEEKNKAIEEQYGLQLYHNEEQEEQIANYIMDLEAKVKNAEIIDFVRSVSPILYRLFFRLAKQTLPELESVILNAKNDQYDTWKFHEMAQLKNPVFQAYISERRTRNVTTSSLLELLELSNLPKDTVQLMQDLRQFEKSVRNPLAHLIKPFDEAELHRTTKFSSKIFLEKIILLAQKAGIHYQRQPFYFNQINDIIKKEWT